MQTTRSKPKRRGGAGSTIALLLLGFLLLAGVALYCFTRLVPHIEADLTDRVSTALSGTGLTAENVRVEGTDVTLLGQIDSAAAAGQAEQIAMDVYGVSHVYNELENNLEQSEEQSEQETTEQQDAGIANSSEETAENASGSKDEAGDEAKKASENNTQNAEDSSSNSNNDIASGESDAAQSDLEQPSDVLVAPSSLEVVIDDDKALVRGILPNAESADRVIAAVADKFGKEKVRSELSIVADSEQPSWLDSAITIIGKMDKIQNPSLKIFKNEVALGGMASSETLGAQQLAAAKRELGDTFNVAGNFQITPRANELPAPEQKPRQIKKRPASLKIDNTPNGVKLTGIISSAAEAQMIRSGLNDLLGQTDYADELIIDDSVAEANWIKEALEVTKNVNKVDNFAVSINSGQMMLSGDVQSREAGKTLAGTATKLANDKLTVVNNYAVQQAELVLESREEVLARELTQKLVSLETTKIVFEPGSAVLAPDAKVVLDEAAAVIVDYSEQVVEISGHTDASGDPVNNLELSKKRAIAVRDYLVTKGLPSNQLRPIGYGESKPVADNSTPAGRAANRRIEFNL